MALCVSVAIDDIINKIDKLYDYCVPEHFINEINVGVRVVVPFSKSNMTKKAVVLNVFNSDETANLKTIISVVDKDPVINDFQIELLKLLKSKYFITHYKAFKAIVPRGIDYKINQRYVAVNNFEEQSAPENNVTEKTFAYLFIAVISVFLLASVLPSNFNKIFHKKSKNKQN